MSRLHPIIPTEKSPAPARPGLSGEFPYDRDTRAPRAHHLDAPVTVVIAGEPVAKARPRVTRRGIAYTPAHTRKYEAHGRLAAQLAMGDRPPIEAPVRLELVAELPIPVSWSGRKRSLAVSGDVLPTCRPDVDNYVKAAIDSLNEIVVRDDSQIVEITARKRFSIAPKLVMTVFPLDAGCSNRGAK